ncbi:hypothetical protein IFT90_15205 [Frigoribacterium sp. CFBP 8766]|nr:hypothetical protein [Frigoribacterium sp. CFBP 8766]
MRTRPTTRLALSGLAALALVAGLAACTSSTTDDAAPTPSTTPSATAEADGAPVVNECVDGQAVLSGAEKDISLPDGCDTVYVVTSDATVDLGGPVAKLFFEGTGNTVTYTGDAPEIGGTTDGDGNTTTAR